MTRKTRMMVGIGWIGAMLLWVGCPTPPLQNCSIPGDCAANSSCVEGRCVPFTGCVSDLSCEWPKNQCVTGYCVPNATCQTSKDCTTAGQACVQERCVQEPKPEVGAVLFLQFEENEGANTIRDSSARPQTVAWRGQRRTVAAGYEGKAVFLEGQANYLEVSTSTVLQQPKVTVEMWVRPLQHQDATLARLCDASCRSGYSLSLNAQGLLSFQVGNGTTTQSCTLEIPLPLQQWSHVGGSFDGQQLRCFLNGVVQKTSAWSGSIAYTQTAPFWLGGQPDGTRQFVGEMDEVVVWPWAREQSFLPGWLRYLYVAGSEQQIHVMDVQRGEVLSEHKFPTLSGFRPVGLGPDGKDLYVWNSSESQLAVVDVSTKQRRFSFALPGAGWSDGAKVSFLQASSTLWVWGNTTYVYRYPLVADAKPLAVLQGLGKFKGEGIAWDGKRRKFLISDGENARIRQISETSWQMLPDFVLQDSKYPKFRPGAIAVNPVHQNLYVAGVDSSLLLLFTPKGEVYEYLGQYGVVDTSPDVTTDKERWIERMNVHVSGLYLVYTFTKPSYVYRLDIQDKLQHVIRGKSTGSPVQRFRSSYGMYFHPQGDIMVVQDGNSGLFHMIDIDKRIVIRSLNLGQSTVPGQWPLVGMGHPVLP